MENKILIPIAILVIGMCLAMLIAIRSIKPNEENETKNN